MSLRDTTTTSEAARQENVPGYYKFGKIPWWVLAQMEEMDYVQDIEFMNKKVHYREQREMNAKRRAANERDRRDRLARKFNQNHHNV